MRNVWWDPESRLASSAHVSMTRDGRHLRKHFARRRGRRRADWIGGQQLERRGSSRLTRLCCCCPRYSLLLLLLWLLLALPRAGP
jgi:hypothetical protein